jgi:hypothetical protein
VAVPGCPPAAALAGTAALQALPLSLRLGLHRLKLLPRLLVACVRNLPLHVPQLLPVLLPPLLAGLCSGLEEAGVAQPFGASGWVTMPGSPRRVALAGAAAPQALARLAVNTRLLRLLLLSFQLPVCAVANQSALHNVCCQPPQLFKPTALLLLLATLPEQLPLHASLRPRPQLLVQLVLLRGAEQGTASLPCQLIVVASTGQGGSAALVRLAPAWRLPFRCICCCSLLLCGCSNYGKRGLRIAVIVCASCLIPPCSNTSSGCASRRAISRWCLRSFCLAAGAARGASLLNASLSPGPGACDTLIPNSLAGCACAAAAVGAGSLASCAHRRQQDVGQRGGWRAGRVAQRGWIAVGSAFALGPSVVLGSCAEADQPENRPCQPYPFSSD